MDLTQPLHAAGKIKILGICKDSEFELGWFNSKTPEPDRDFVKLNGPRNFIGVAIDGSNWSGNQIKPMCNPNKGKGYVKNDNAPFLIPQQIYDFTIDYTLNPDGTGMVITTLNGLPAAPLAVPKDAVDSSVFDSFGVVSRIDGGMYIKFAIDDIEYTVRK